MRAACEAVSSSVSDAMLARRALSSSSFIEAYGEGGGTSESVDKEERSVPEEPTSDVMSEIKHAPILRASKMRPRRS